MKIAYLISVHRCPVQLTRLVNALNTPIINYDPWFFIHVDKKSFIQDFAQQCNHDNVRFIHQREEVHWGDFSQVTATLNLLREAIVHNADYYIFLSGQDYPIKSTEYIYNYFSHNSTSEFIEYSPISSDGLASSMWRFQRTYLPGSWIPYRNVRMTLNHTVIRLLPLPPRRFLPGFQPYGGSQWWCLTHSCISYILEFIENNKHYESYFRYTICPDEMFFQTIIINSPYQERVINDNLRFIDWSDCEQGKGYSPNVITCDYIESLASSAKLFARKFDINVDTNILNFIDANLR
jgi:hypothetical protein